MASPDPEDLLKMALRDEAPAAQVVASLIDRDAGKVRLPEGPHIDFKQMLDLDEDRPLGGVGKDILGFSNSEGGLIVVGVVDGTGEVVGHGLLDPAKLRERVWPWIGTQVDFSVGNTQINIQGKTHSLGYIFVKRTSHTTPGLLRKHVELRPGLLKKLRYLPGSLPYRSGDETIVEPPGPGIYEVARELGFNYVAFRTKSSFLTAEDRPGIRLYAHLNNTFVGREDELAELLGRFEDPRGRGVSIAGLGGIGKTELAIELVHRLYIQKRFSKVYSGSAKRTLLTSEGVQEADPLFSDYHTLLRDLAAWLGVEPSCAASDDELERICITEISKAKRVLLFVDNLETVDDPPARDHSPRPEAAAQHLDNRHIPLSSHQERDLHEGSLWPHAGRGR